jgi:hypothetical protein
MRLIRRLAASVWLSAALAGPVVPGLAVGLGLAALAPGPAVAAVAAPAGGAYATVSPESTTPGGTIEFAISCASESSASATFFGTSLGLPAQIPMNKGAGPGDYTVTVTIPDNIRPGNYRPRMGCADGSVASADLLIAAVPRQGAATGDGTTSTRTNNGLAVVGLAMIGVGALVGGIALRRKGPTRP